MIIQHKEYKCRVRFEKYQNNDNTAILLHGAPGTEYEHELITFATVNGEMVANENVVGIKTWSENEGIVQSLVDGGVIEEELLFTEPTHFVSIEYYPLTDEAYAELKRQSAATDRHE